MGLIALLDCHGAKSSADGAPASFLCSGSAQDCLHALAGDYAGTYSGDTRGTWKVTISALGRLAGSAHNTVNGGDFDLAGTADEAGRMLFGTSSDGNAFSGQVSEDFSVSGTWSLAPHSGTFVGRRTSTPPAAIQADAGTTNANDASAETGCYGVAIDLATGSTVQYCRNLAPGDPCEPIGGELAPSTVLPTGCSQTAAAKCIYQDGKTVFLYQNPTDSIRKSLCGPWTADAGSSGQDAKPNVPCPSVAEQLGSCAQFNPALLEIPDIATDPCYWRIDPVPTDPALVNIAIDCVVLPLGTQDADGSWSWEGSGLRLTDETCNALTTKGADRIDYIYGCPTVE